MRLLSLYATCQSCITFHSIRLTLNGKLSSRVHLLRVCHNQRFNRWKLSSVARPLVSYYIKFPAGKVSDSAVKTLLPYFLSLSCRIKAHLFSSLWRLIPSRDSYYLCSSNKAGAIDSSGVSLRAVIMQLLLLTPTPPFQIDQVLKVKHNFSSEADFRAIKSLTLGKVTGTFC